MHTVIQGQKLQRGCDLSEFDYGQDHGGTYMSYNKVHTCNIQD